MPSAVLVQFLVSISCDLSQALFPFSFFLPLLKLCVDSLFWLGSPTNRSTRTTEQWHAITVRAERGAQSEEEAVGIS